MVGLSKGSVLVRSANDLNAMLAETRLAAATMRAHSTFPTGPLSNPPTAGLLLHRSDDFAFQSPRNGTRFAVGL